MKKYGMMRLICIYKYSKRQKMYPPRYYQSGNDSIVTHAIGHMNILLVSMKGRVLNKLSMKRNKTGLNGLMKTK